MVEKVNQRFLQQFSKIWQGGYFEGDPLDPMAPSTYGIYGYNSVLYTTYLACIRPYVASGATALEIGPGRGAWSKAILSRGCAKLYAVDAAPPEHTRFFDHVGDDARVEYLTVDDFSLAGVPMDSIDFFFSFGVFCHLKPEMCESYVAALAPRMKAGSHGFLMIADFDKYRHCQDAAEVVSINCIFEHKRLKRTPVALGWWLTWRFQRGAIDLTPIGKIRKGVGRDGRGAWYHWGLEAACAAIEGAGLEVFERDVGVNARDPVIHFGRPPTGAVNGATPGVGGPSSPPG